MSNTELDFAILDVRAGIEADNERNAEKVRAFLKSRHCFLINLMASPGAGKTSLICRILDALSGLFSVGVLEADMDDDVDARTVSSLGAKVIQLHTGTSCHMDAQMTLRGLEAFGDDLPEVVILENVGNLVCPAEFDVGADLKLMILSVPEGDDKPLKYPLMFTVSDWMVVNKTDTLPVFDFDFSRLERNVRLLNPSMPVFPLSAKTGDGVSAFTEALAARIRAGLEDKRNV